jgi:hypothetical protein
VTIPGHIESGGSEIVVGNGRGGPTGGAGPIERLSLARPVLPCPGCVHAAVCSIRPLLDPEKLAFRTPPTPHEAIRVRLVIDVECSHFLADPSWSPPEAPKAIPPHATARESSRRGAEASKRLRAAAKAPAAAGGGPGRIRKPWSPEARAAQSMLVKASIERRRAAAGSGGA